MGRCQHNTQSFIIVSIAQKFNIELAYRIYVFMCYHKTIDALICLIYQVSQELFSVLVVDT